MQVQENSQQIYEKYPRKDASCLIDMLQDVQEHFGYLPDAEMQRVARHIDIPVSRVYGVATFYNQFRFQPLGKYVIRVCRGTACHVKGSLDILRTLENELGIKAGQTSKDLRFTIETVACIGACSIAPVIAVNDEFHGGLTTKSLQKLLKSYQKNDRQSEVQHEHV
ncbi:MAG: NADH-quinone oxidoreductase subunit NuoE [Bacteroidetes bacterium]|nr:NADH-quinone oxidoreductase subunit NuoE [Bacteroidota bacterium]